MPKKDKKKRQPDIRHQVAALPVRERDGQLEVCLITTRETSRWSIPKGWPMKGRDDWEAARIEAEQEAGLVGTVAEEPCGSFVYWKRRAEHFDLVEVSVYPLHVNATLPTWKEIGQRQVRWVLPADAALVVEEPGLSSLLQGVKP
ncbi:NUDIX hydrolase [Labrys sp. La1]|uniref:NUDIX hydrolase n=1 Tax=Labrys sp. La1 TaxID=3404917 RepID=UPI003EBCD247